MRAVPPPDISPLDFFASWVPEAVGSDPERQQGLSGLRATIQFELEGEDGGAFFLAVHDGSVSGAAGRLTEPDLTLSLSVGTWRRLNAGELNAIQAAGAGALRFRGNLHLALRMHFLLR
jgi:putative sterol carrier protein